MLYKGSKENTKEVKELTKEGKENGRSPENGQLA